MMESSLKKKNKKILQTNQIVLQGEPGESEGSRDEYGKCI